MRSTLDWSHDLLDKRDRTLFRRLGIFVNGFTIEGALAVGTDDDFNEVDVFDALASLADKSLVMADPRGDAVRYRLLESTRVYACEQLAQAGEREALASRHLRYFRDWFVELRREREQLRDGLEAAFPAELDDLFVALDGALIRREVADGAELLAAIDCAWRNARLGREGLKRCEAFVAELPRSEPGLVGKLGASLINILHVMGRYTQAREAGIAAIGYARTSGDGPTLAAALNHYAGALIDNRDFPAAECALREAEAIEGVSPLRRLLLLDCRANLSMETGDLDSARTPLPSCAKNGERLDFAVMRPSLPPSWPISSFAGGSISALPSWRARRFCASATMTSLRIFPIFSSSLDRCWP